MTPGAFRARDVSIPVIFAWGTGLRQSLACTIPVTTTSLMKRARPVAVLSPASLEERRADPLHRRALVLGRALARVDGLAHVGGGDVLQKRHRARLAIGVDLGGAHAALPEHRGAAERPRRLPRHERPDAGDLAADEAIVTADDLRHRHRAIAMTDGAVAN